MSVLKPLHNAILFQFLNETSAGLFMDKNKGRIIIATPEIDKQGAYARWVRVESVGPAVTNCKPGDIVLLHKGKWTIGFVYEEQRLWKTDDSWVLAIGEESMAYDFVQKDV